MKRAPDKRMSLKQAVADLVHDGDTVYLAGFLQHDPMAAVHELIRQEKRNLTVSKAGGLLALDMLMGAGCVSKAITSYVWNPLPRPAHGFVRAVREDLPRRVDLQEFSLLSLTLAYFAGALDLPYIPTRTMIGSDLLKQALRNLDRRVRMGKDPFTGERIVKMAPLRHDVGFIQVQRADLQGNAQAWGFLGDSEWGILSCDRIVVCAEEIVSHRVIRSDPDRTLIPAFRTHAVVKVPFGAHPLFVMGYYEMDWPFMEFYEKETATTEGFHRFLDQWILKTRSHDGYLRKLCRERLTALKPKQTWEPAALSYGRFPSHNWVVPNGKETQQKKKTT